MRLTEVMNRHVVTVRPDDLLRTAAQTILWTEHRHFPVVANGDVVGVLSEREFLRHAGDLDRPVREVMSRPAITISSDESVDTAARRIALHRIGCLPVLHQGVLIGIATASDLLRAFVRSRRDDRARSAKSFVARDAMTPTAVTAGPDEYLVNAIAKMQLAGVRHLPVTDSDGRLVGIVSDRDIRLESISLDGPFPKVKDDAARIRTVMREDVLTVGPEAPAADLTAAFSDWRLGALPVVDENRRLLGIISYVDVLAELSRQSER